MYVELITRIATQKLEDEHGDEHRLPEDIEEEEVKCTEDTYHCSLHYKEGYHKFCDLFIYGLP